MVIPACAFAACLAAVLQGVPPPAQAVSPAAPDVVLTNGRIFTADPGMPWVEALAVTGTRISAVGTTPAIEALAGPHTRRIDLAGRLVVPGFNDAHDHIGCHVQHPVMRVGTGAGTPPDPPFALVADSLRAAVARAPAGTWLHVSAGAAVLDDPRANRAVLDSIAPAHPVQLLVWTGHDAILNSAALAALGITNAVQDGGGPGHVREDHLDRLTGRLEEYGVWRAWRTLCDAQEDTALVRALRARGERMVRLGITSTQAMAHQLSPERLVTVLAAAALPVRVRLVPMPLDPPQDPAREWGDVRGTRRAADGEPGDVVVSGIKWILDGSPVERRAAHRVAYLDRPGEFGTINFSAGELAGMLRLAHEQRLQPLLHAVGDSTAALVLDLLDATGGEAAWRDRRVRIEHGDGLLPDLQDRARRLGVIVVQNPTHFSLGDLLRERYEPALVERVQPLRALVEAGIPVVLGGDGSYNPFVNIMMAVTHPHRPEQALTREQAVQAYTRGSAHAEFAEHEKGSLAVGMLADLAVLSQDIFTVAVDVLPRTTSVLTMIGGRVVHDEVTAAEAGGARPRRPASPAVHVAGGAAPAT